MAHTIAQLLMTNIDMPTTGNLLYNSLLIFQYTEQPDIEKEVKRLFRTDNEAVHVKWEIVTDDDDKLNKIDDMSQEGETQSQKIQGDINIGESETLKRIINSTGLSKSMVCGLPAIDAPQTPLVLCTFFFCICALIHAYHCSWVPLRYSDSDFDQNWNPGTREIPLFSNDPNGL
jgi:hypothetical protein